MAIDELAQRLFGARRAESDAILTDATTGTIHGVALTDSEGGAVTVEITADVTAPEPLEVGGETYFADAGVGVEIPTSESVRAGDEVLVSTYGAGTMRSPVVTAAVGSGDRMAAAISNAETLAQQAEAVATATGQYFWHDENGAHVTEAAREDWETSQTGPNSLWNSLGMLFRDGLNNLMAVLTSGIAIYDGNGNTADHILAEFMADHVRVGGNVPVGAGGEAAIQFFDQTETHQSGMDASVSVEENEDVPGYPFYDLRSTVGVRSALDDEGRVVDTGSKGQAALSLEQELSYGLVGSNEQFTETHAALVADATYDEDATYPTTSHARVAATATTGTTSGSASGLSYVELIADALGIGTNEGAIDYTTMAQVLAAIRRPTATYTGSSSTTTDSASGWKLTWFNVALATNGPVGDYFTNSNGVITAVRDCKLLISCAMRWQDSTAGQRGIGLFTGVNGGDSGGTETCSTFEYFDQTNSSNRAVYLPPRLFALSAGDHITVRRNTQNHAVYTNGPGMSWLTVEVVG